MHVHLLILNLITPVKKQVHSRVSAMSSTKLPCFRYDGYGGRKRGTGVGGWQKQGTVGVYIFRTIFVQRGRESINLGTMTPVRYPGTRNANPYCMGDRGVWRCIVFSQRQYPLICKLCKLQCSNGEGDRGVSRMMEEGKRNDGGGL